jgi:hypothetical protein
MKGFVSKDMAEDGILIGLGRLNKIFMEYHPCSPNQHIIISAEEALDLARKNGETVVMKCFGEIGVAGGVPGDIASGVTDDVSVDITVDPETSTLTSIIEAYHGMVKALTDPSTAESSRLSSLRESAAEHALHVAKVEAFDLKNMSGILDWIDKLYELQNYLILDGRYTRVIIYAFARNGFKIWNPYSREAADGDQKFRQIVGEALYLLYNRGHLNWEFICKLRNFRQESGI